MTTTYLLDANVVIALAITDHEHHGRVSAWAATVDKIALCPIVEGALIRFLVRVGETTATATAILGAFHRSARCEFWADSLSHSAVDLSEVTGHRQVTDSYLAALAADRSGQLATLDRALAAAHPAGTILIPDG